MNLPGDYLVKKGILENGEGKNLIENELSLLAGSCPWLDDEEIHRLPGPIAYEYVGFKEVMFEGNLEAACWKITNLVQAIVSYLFAVCLEDQGFQQSLDKIMRKRGTVSSIGFKVNYIRKHYKSPNSNSNYIAELMSTFRDILEWRNLYGVGHGTLTKSGGSHLNDLLSFSRDLTNRFKGFNTFLAKNNLGLLGPNGGITGNNYFINFSGKEWYSRLCCSNNTPIPKGSWPIIFFGYQFDGPDIYFLDCIYRFGSGMSFLYRNFRRNRVKYYDDQNKIVWGREPLQVAWLNEGERNEWRHYFINNNYNNNKAHGRQLWDTIVDAAEQFQDRGMYTEAEWCIEAFNEKCRQTGIPKACNPVALKLKINLTRYSIHAARGEYDRTEAPLQKALELLGDTDLHDFYDAKIALKRSWYEGVFRKNLIGALNICQEAIDRIEVLKEKYPYTALIYELELKKNLLYLYRTNKERNQRWLKEMCLDVLKKAYSLYRADPDNLRFVDIMGFACNLYSFYSLDLLSRIPSINEQHRNEEIDLIEQLDCFSREVRERAYKMDPTDVWIVRGYAWSLHRSARLLLELKKDNKDQEQAIKLLEKARNIRNDYRNNENHRNDIGVMEDLIKNYVELFQALGSPEEKASENRSEAERLLNNIITREGSSPRVGDLEKIVQKTY